MKKDIAIKVSVSSAETRSQADIGIRRFATHLPKILIRRHEESRWFRDRLIELPLLHRWMINVQLTFQLRAYVLRGDCSSEPHEMIIAEDIPLPSWLKRQYVSISTFRPRSYIRAEQRSAREPRSRISWCKEYHQTTFSNVQCWSASMESYKTFTGNLWPSIRGSSALKANLN